MTDIEKRCNYILHLMKDDGWFNRQCTKIIRNGIHDKYKVNYTTSQIRNALERLKRDGQVKINEALSSGTHTTWELIK